MELTEKQIVAGATNNPDLSDTTFYFAGKEFKVRYLPYEEFIQFMAYLKPLAEATHGSFVGLLANETNTLLSLISAYCSDNLPRMVTMVAKNVDDTVTLQWVLQNARNPIQLAKIVIQQIKVNKLIDDFADFFEYLLPMKKAWDSATSSTTP